MSARRYSGNATIYLDLVEDGAAQIPDRPATYRCVVRDHKSGARAVVLVGSPVTIAVPVDCPEAIDDAARAAVAFVIADGLDVSPAYDGNGAGYHVARTRERVR